MVLPKVLGKKVLGKWTWFYPLPTNYVLVLPKVLGKKSNR